MSAAAAPAAPAAAPVRLNPLDASWVFTESRATPNHVGGLLVFRLPPGAPRTYLRELMAEFRTHRGFTAPWNRKLRSGFTVHPLPAWVVDDDIDLEYHVRHAALPWPGGERELGELVGRLQSTPIDLARPPWEVTIVEGLEGDRFALFVKMHHSLIDGISGMKLLQKAMSTDREESRGLPPFWASGIAAPPRRARPAPSAPTVAEVFDTALEGLTLQAQTLPKLAGAFAQMIGRIGGRGPGMALPFDAPLSVLNGRVREKRRFATQQLPVARLRTLAKAADGTLNDVVLAVCGGALRRFLLERESLPDQPLTAGIPVSVRPQDDDSTGNAITFIVASLGTDVEDPVERFRAVQSSVRLAKAHVQSLPRAAMTQYTLLLMAPTILTLLTGIGGRTRPMFNITISNVPGPEKTLYFKGAEMVAIYPASIVTHGQALNITCESYDGQMNFGYTGCHSSVPSLQKLAVYSADALAELEARLLAKPGTAQAPVTTKGEAAGNARRAVDTGRTAVAARKSAGAPRRTGAAPAPAGAARKTEALGKTTTPGRPSASHGSRAPRKAAAVAPSTSRPRATGARASVKRP